MPTAAPVAQTMKLSDVKTQLSGLVTEVSLGKTRVLIEENGVPVAALVSIADLERLARWEREKAERWKAIEAIGAAFADVPLEELEAQINRIMTEGPQLDEERGRRRRVLDAMREPFRGVAFEEIERETAKAVAEVRAEMRAEREAAARKAG